LQGGKSKHAHIAGGTYILTLERIKRESERCLEEEKEDNLDSKEEFKNPTPLSISKN
jgi:hypothetical protein